MLGGECPRTPRGGCHHADSGRQLVNVVIAETLRHRPQPRFGQTTEAADQRFKFRGCRADDENAQGCYFFVDFGLRMFTPPWFRYSRGVIISIISLCVGPPYGALPYSRLSSLVK